MTHLGSPGDGRSRSGRHRARHTDAAPDPYVDEGNAPGDALRGGPYRDRYAGPQWDSEPPRWSRREPRHGEPPSGDPWRGEPPGGQPRHGQGRFAASPGDVPPAARQPPPAGPGGPAQPPPERRAGRNLPAAIAVGVTLGAVIVASLVVWRPAFLGVVIAAVAIGIWEMARALRAGGARPPLTPLLVGGVLMACLAWFSGPSALAIGLLLTVLATMVWRLADGPAGYHRDIAAAKLIAIYVPFLAGFAAMLGAPDDGTIRVIVTLAAVVVSDTAGYVSGVFLGRHPMAPSVSPKKTWEGLAGSLAASAVGGAVALPILLHVPWWWGLLFGVAASAAAVLGDLTESLLKRDLGIKDMGSLLPGHGGLMDRLDSILFAAPTAYLLLSVLAPATR